MLRISAHAKGILASVGNVPYNSKMYIFMPYRESHLYSLSLSFDPLYQSLEWRHVVDQRASHWRL
jgi:hypothetical protein